MLRSIIFAFLLADVAEGQRKLDTGQATLLAEARLTALTYSDSLPDFICTESIRRLEEEPLGSDLLPVDNLTVSLTYFGHKETYQLVAVKGRPTSLKYDQVGGARTTGEFGSKLVSLFVPESKAEFDWKGWTRLRGRRAAVLQYRITKENSSLRISSLRTGAGTAGEPNSIFAGYRGEVFVDEATRRVLRLTERAELPMGFPIREATLAIEYDFREIGGRDYLLPVRAESINRTAGARSVNRMEFGDYRKFQGDSTISFDTPDDRPKPQGGKK